MVGISVGFAILFYIVYHFAATSKSRKILFGDLCLSHKQICFAKALKEGVNGISSKDFPESEFNSSTVETNLFSGWFCQVLLIPFFGVIIYFACTSFRSNKN